jgi:hypothetical protein
MDRFQCGRGYAAWWCWGGEGGERVTRLDRNLAFIGHRSDVLTTRPILAKVRAKKPRAATAKEVAPPPVAFPRHICRRVSRISRILSSVRAWGTGWQSRCACAQAR